MLRRRKKLFGGARFNPLVYSPALWLDASDQSTLFQDRTGASASTPVASNADPAGTWKDKSGNARHVTAGSDSTRPTYTTNKQNGLPMLVSDGVDDTLFVDSATWFGSATNITVFGVVKPAAAAAADSNTFAMMLNCQNGGTGTQWVNYLGGSSTGSLSGEKFAPFFNSNGRRTGIGAAYVRPANTAEVWTGTFGTSGMKVYQNGNELTVDLFSTGDATTACGPASVTISTPRLYIGSTGQPFVCGEVLVFTSTLSTAQRQQVERYLGNKWGIAVP